MVTFSLHLSCFSAECKGPGMRITFMSEAMVHSLKSLAFPFLCGKDLLSQVQKFNCFCVMLMSEIIEHENKAVELPLSLHFHPYAWP